MPSVVAVTSDLIFSTKIVGTAKALRIDARSVANPAALGTILDSGSTRLVMVDMDLPGDNACAAIRLAAGHPSSPHVVAYFSHVRADLRDAAREAGAEEILPRSVFVEQLATLIRRATGDEKKPDAPMN